MGNQSPVSTSSTTTTMPSRNDSGQYRGLYKRIDALDGKAKYRCIYNDTSYAFVDRFVEVPRPRWKQIGRTVRRCHRYKPRRMRNKQQQQLGEKWELVEIDSPTMNR